jgi:PHD/YefM family antitoxin component YafN of YafNO toxin-antitoxin module
MIREISAMDLRKKLGEILNFVNLKHEPIVIRRGEQVMAVLIDIDTFHNKVSSTSSSDSLRDFSNQISAKLEGYKFNRDDANAR